MHEKLQSISNLVLITLLKLPQEKYNCFQKNWKNQDSILCQNTQLMHNRKMAFYRLIYGRAPMHTFSRTANNRNLVALMPENAVWVNPQVAELWGLKKDQYVWLKNQDGVVSNFSVKVRVTERIRWDSVYIVHGFGHHHKPLNICLWTWCKRY